VASAGFERPVTAAEIADRLRKSNDESRQRGRRFLAFGDALFQSQRFHEALQRYKSAAEAAPDLAEAYYRQGFALIAVNQYKLAVKAFKIALELDSNVIHIGPRLDQLYDGSGLAKASHLEALAGEALDRGGDLDLVFLVGMFLFADGQWDRSKKFFARAAAAAGPDAKFLQPLLDATPPVVLPPAKKALAKGTTAPIKT
jgi:tetratricopeptide (TPR) repeat protein